jgi:hypothetical protein
MYYYYYLFSDEELRQWEQRIQMGKKYLQVFLWLRDLAYNTGCPPPTDTVMAKALKISAEEAILLHLYAFELLRADEMEYIRYRSCVDLVNDEPDCPFGSWDPLAILAEALSEQEFPDFR